MKWFKKKKKEEAEQKPDFTNYRIVINGKVMCAYEAMTGKPFLKIETEEDIKKLFYCSFVFSNPEFSTMKYEVFEFLIRDNEVSEWMAGEYVKIGEFLSQFNSDILSDDEDEEEDKDKKGDGAFFMLEALSGLIVRMGIDPRYVMYEMDEWEITYYYRIMREMDRERLIENRLWTYLQILPHCGKKLQSPEKMLPFAWEKQDKRKKKELDNNTKAALAFFAKQEENGERRFDDSIGQAAISSGQSLAVADERSGADEYRSECDTTGSDTIQATGKNQLGDEKWDGDGQP